jgi:hypothetical protein
MAAWRGAVELAMTGEEIEPLTALSRSRTEAARRVERAQMLLAYRRQPSFFALGQRLGVHHQTGPALRTSGHWAMARWGPSTTDRDRARSRRSRRKRKPGWYLWRATRPRGCGRFARSWHAKAHRATGHGSETRPLFVLR